MAEGPSSEDTFRILVVSDTHIGYLERDPIRGNDSFHTWEEVLKRAAELKVDFVLHGGDMFHDNKPSRKTMFRTMEIIRKYCFGDSNIQMQIVSDQAKNFPNFKTVNFEDPNFNISVPIFIIHGNHDDPAGDGQYSALDILSACNFINYFGKSPNIDDITMYPIFLVKGTTKLALYGLGNIRDERLSRTWSQKKVKFMRPIKDAENALDNWFNIFVIHQNRIAHSPKNYISEAMIESWMDFVLWGHEHECKIKPAPSSEGDFYVCQPGSTIATALSEMEAKEKHIGLLEICGDKFRLNEIKLKTVRPFLIEDICLASFEDEMDNNEAEPWAPFLEKKVKEVIDQAKKISDTLPIIRLRIDYTGYSSLNSVRFGQRFVGKVANPSDILLFHRKKIPGVAKVGKTEETELLKAALKPDPLDDVAIEDLISGYLGVAGANGNLDLLLEHEFHGALRNFVEKDEKSAIEEYINKQLSITQKYLQTLDPEASKTPEAIQKLVLENTIKLRQAQGRDDESQQRLVAFVKSEKEQPIETTTSASQTPKKIGKKLGSSSDVDEDDFSFKKSTLVKKEQKKGNKKKRARNSDSSSGEESETSQQPPNKKRKISTATPKKTTIVKQPTQTKLKSNPNAIKSSPLSASSAFPSKSSQATPLMFTIEDSDDEDQSSSKKDVVINTSKYGARKSGGK